MISKLSLVLLLVSIVLSVSHQVAEAQLPAGVPRPMIGAYGLAVPKDQVFMQAAIDGHVQQIFFTEGQLVKKGDVVIELACEPAKARCKIAQLEAENKGSLAAATAELEVAQSSFDRLAILRRQQATTEQEISEAELRLKRAQAAVNVEGERLTANQARFELAKAELEQFRLRAPFDGQVVQVVTGPGSAVSRSSNLIQIVSLDTYRVDIFLPVDQANELHPGQTIPIQINTPYELSMAAQVVFRSPLIEAATGTTRIVLEIDNRNLKLPAGVTVSLSDSRGRDGSPSHSDSLSRSDSQASTQTSSLNDAPPQ
jgi:RND family efflux transporter MFP subunit